MFAIIDIETSGGKYQFPNSRITEICILIHDGLVVTHTFSTLINPECYISPFFTNLTGITNAMVSSAPTFKQVANMIIELTTDKIFVAHNVTFDYNFIRDEFYAIGVEFNCNKLCTVQMSRKLMPGKPTYSLGKLCASLNIPNNARHRAEGDAVATAKLFDMLLEIKSRKK